MTISFNFIFQFRITPPPFPKMLLTSCMISYHPHCMFLNHRPLLHPFHRRPTHFSEEIYILSFCGVIYVNPYPINVGTSTQYFSLGLPNYSTDHAFVFSYTQLNILVILHSVPLPISPCIFISITPSSIFTFTIGYTPVLERSMYLPHVFSPRVL